jgi:hypothetical protein
MTKTEARVVATYLGSYAEVGEDVPDGATRVNGVWYSIEEDGSIHQATSRRIYTSSIISDILSIKEETGKFPRKYELHVSREITLN